MSGRVAGKVALVTGGAMGIGEAAVRRFAAEGASVVIADIAVELGETLAREIGGGALFIRHDVTVEAGWHVVMATILAQFGRLDIVFNNAGLVSLGTAESVTDDDWAKHIALHLDATALGSRLGLKAMRAGGRPGSIINMASTSTVKGYSPHFAYLAGKGAVRGLTRSAAAYCTTLGLPIRFNCIIPGGILTPMAAVFAEMTKTMPGDVQFSSSAGTADADRPIDLSALGAPDDVALLALYLGSDEARFVNGGRVHRRQWRDAPAAQTAGRLSTSAASSGEAVFLTDIAGAFGPAIAQAIVASGAKLVAGCSSPDVPDDCVGYNPAAATDWERVLDEAVARVGTLTGVVNNPDTLIFGSIEDLDLDGWHSARAGGLDAAMHAMRACLPRLRSVTGSSLVNVCSIASEIGLQNYASYSATAFALRTMARSAAIHAREKGYATRVNCVIAGFDDKGPLAALVPEAAVAAADVAAMVVYLLSDASRGATAAEFTVDNGGSMVPT